MPCNAHFSGPANYPHLLMCLMVNSLFKGKTKATIEISGQFLLSGKEFELIRTKQFFHSVSGFETDLTQYAL